MLLHIEEEDIGRVVLKTYTSWTLREFFDAKVGGMRAQLGTLALIRDQMYCQGNRTVLH